ncbi:hypothetical protein [Peptostreptococcus stomatis]|uniref:hypothetical protein n=2 Tax=Peptostreptococcus stomatis TaxID=341694 RepID=UPI0028D842F0|nr:hypothetical protein [Peptostreptococcus stomatis]
MNLESRLRDKKMKSNSRTRKAYIMVEVVVYLMIASLIFMSIGLIFRSSISIKTSIVNKIEMREMASVVEDRIRYEMNNSIGITRVWGKNTGETSYKNVRKIEYRAYDKLQKEVLLNKYISIEGDRIYVENEGKYQIGRHIETMDIDDKGDYMKYKLGFKIGKNTYSKKFILLKKLQLLKDDRLNFKGYRKG